jgi:UDP-N-acetylmuramate--alanine ligase
MNLKDIKKVYFLGIGGIGMSALARYFKSLGVEVSGYDKTQTALTDQLIAEGIDVTFEDEVSSLPKDIDMVIYTPAIPKDHRGFNFYKDNNYALKKRSEILGLISADKFSICVAGSHGKTTVSAMIAHILTQSGYGCSAFLGGIATNYQSNYIQHDNDVVVIEADEFDRSFHRLSPDMAVITAIDTDHLDIWL